MSNFPQDDPEPKQWHDYFNEGKESARIEIEELEAENKALKDVLDSCYKMMACYWNAANDGHPLYHTTQGIIQEYHALKR